MTDKTHHRARKRFGQHFLADTAVVQQIVNTIAVGESDHVVEIGPGLGVMTEAILPLARYLDAVELDRDLVSKLNQSLPLGKFAIHSADALKFEFCSLVKEQEKLRIVGNLPYNISTPLIFRLLEQLQCIEDMHFMLQKEVVNRLAASPGHGSYGRLSVMVQYYCRVEKLFDVAPDAFSPPPKVDSSVVRLIPHPKPPVDVQEKQTFDKVVSAAFAQRRKTLRNNLKSMIEADQMHAAGIDPGRRAETLTLQEFATLSNIISQ
ncbi:MAG: 16S rRNA (adenine(1518)-N(6)/adenine(1519)-N(6))-dimethyltransferase RsmA [Gammaproteobacteria bacterium]|jgi:16S rRNA (adenine1518-N6/adenine1519-N6)-dimethyltransferase